MTRARSSASSSSRPPADLPLRGHANRGCDCGRRPQARIWRCSLSRLRSPEGESRRCSRRLHGEIGAVPPVEPENHYYRHNPPASVNASVRSLRRTGQGTVTRRVSGHDAVSFESTCSDCLLRAQCTTSRRGRKRVLQQHALLHRAHRQSAQGPAFQATYWQHRPMVERSIAWLTRGNRRVPYRGLAKNNAWLHNRVAAHLRRLLALGLTYQNQTWRLA
jgi:hypothetical protein